MFVHYSNTHIIHVLVLFNKNLMWLEVKKQGQKLFTRTEVEIVIRLEDLKVKKKQFVFIHILDKLISKR